MKFGSLFTGVGGFDLGLERAGIECAWQVEIDKYCNQVLDYRWPDTKRYSDVREVGEELENVEIIVGGFPCQSFSIAGNRAGFEDTRGTLFFEFARILQQKKPQVCIIENVKGLLSHEKGQTFQTILSILDELGYNAEWQVLNSKNFGVPQNRDRVFIIGHLRGERTRQVFPIGKSNETSIKYVKNANSLQDRVYSIHGISPTLVTGTGGNLQPKIVDVSLRAGVKERNSFRTLDTTYRKGLPSLGQPRNGIKIVAVQDNRKGIDSHQQRSGIQVGDRIRRLTPLECERIQGLPDNWTKIGVKNGKEIQLSDTQRYKQIGNSVTPQVIEEITRRLV